MVSRFTDDCMKHLRGELFSPDLFLRISNSSSPMSERIDWIARQVAGATVIHIGCVDHLTMIEAQRTKGLWLHEHLCATASRCIGLDVSEEGVRYVRNALGYNDVFVCDVERDDPPIGSLELWDYLVLGEVIEHTDNPVAFLTSLRRRFRGRVNRLIITVPNAFGWGNFVRAMGHREMINSDHRFWFTPYTLAKIVSRAEMEIELFDWVNSEPVRVRGPRSLLRFLVCRIRPALRDTLVMIVRL